MRYKRGSTTIIPLILIVIVVIFIIILLKNNIDEYKEKVGDNIAKNTKNFEEKLDGTKVNTSPEILKTKSVDDIIIEQSKLVYSGGITKYTAKVTNRGTKTQTELEIIIRFTANDGATITETKSYIGTINPGEIKYINSSITVDAINARDIEIEVVE